MRILKYLFLIMLATFMSVSSVNADTYQLNNLEVQGYNNNGSSLTSPSVFNCSSGSCGMEITTISNSYGGAWAIQSPIPLLKNHTYALSLRIRNTANVGITLSSKNRIAIGNSISSVKYNYESASYWNTLKTSVSVGDYTLQFVFTATGQASYLLIPFTTSSTITTSFMIDNIIIEDLGTEGVTQEEITASLNNQTNEINNSINNSTNTITGSITDSQNNINSNIDDMEQSIVDSNKETQDVIKDQFNTCRDSVNLFNSYDYTYIIEQNANEPTLINSNEISISFYGNWARVRAVITGLKPNSIYTISSYLDKSNYDTNVHSGFYSNQGYQASGLTYSSGEVYYTFTTDNNGNFNNLFYGNFTDTTTTGTIVYKKIQIVEGTSKKDFEPYGEEICSNKIDETNDKLDDLNQSITNDNVNGVQSAFESFEGFIAENSTITQLITMPITLYTSILNGVQSTCQPFVLGNLFGTNLTIPCINIGNYLGSTLWSMIDIIISGFAIFSISKKLIKIFNNFSSMKEGDVIDD